jgi:hypothetical protein
MFPDEVTVRCPVAIEPWSGATHSGVLWQAERRRFQLEIPDVARYLVHDGVSVDIDPHGNAEPATVQRFLEMTPMAALYLQRGNPVLHAAVAVNPAGSAVMLAGDSSAGKSTLLATLLRRGWGMLTDDVAPVVVNSNGIPVVPSLSGVVQLWPDSVQWTTNSSTFEDATEACSGLRQAVDCSSQLVVGFAPIRSIYWLGTHSLDTMEERAMVGVSRLSALGSMAYNSRIAAALLDRSSLLRVFGRIVGSDVSISRVLRPRHRWLVEELADLVEQGGS